MAPLDSAPLADTSVFIAQTSPALGDVRKNLEEHLRLVQTARKSGARVIVFPELSLTGYFLNDLADEVAMSPDDPVLAELAAASRDISILAGYVSRSRDHRIYNSAGFFENGALVHEHRKVYLPTYGIFDDGRYFAAGNRFDAFTCSFGRAGILVCEDAWHLGSSYLLFLQNVDVIFCISASPGRGVTQGGEVSSTRSWDSVLEALSGLYQTYVVYCSRTGVEDGITFFGGSRVLDPFGTILTSVPGLDPGASMCNITNGALRRARLFAPMRRDERPDIVLQHLKRITEEA